MSPLGSNYWLPPFLPPPRSRSCPVAELVQSTGLVHFQGQFYLLVVLGGGAGSGGGKLSDLDLDGQTQSGGVATHTAVGPSCPPSLPLAWPEPAQDNFSLTTRYCPTRSALLAGGGGSELGQPVRLPTEFLHRGRLDLHHCSGAGRALALIQPSGRWTGEDDGGRGSPGIRCPL